MLFRSVLDDARGSAVLEELPSCSFVRCCGCASDEPSIMDGACVLCGEGTDMKQSGWMDWLDGSSSERAMEIRGC